MHISKKNGYKSQLRFSQISEHLSDHSWAVLIIFIFSFTTFGQPNNQILKSDDFYLILKFPHLLVAETLKNHFILEFLISILANLGKISPVKKRLEVWGCFF